MNIVLLIITILAVLFSSLYAFALAGQQKMPPFLSAIIWGTFSIFVGSLVPGALGQYTPLAVSLTTVTFSLVSVLILCRTAQLPLKLPRIALSLSAKLIEGPWNLITVLVALVSAFLLWPIAVCFFKLAQLLALPQAELGWDAVSYHLPALVEFIQAHSLWSFDGPYQSYSYGFELIYGLTLLFCHSHWGVIIGHAVSVVLLLVSAAYITEQLIQTLRESGIANINSLMVHLLVQAIGAGLICNTSLAGVGNNDVFEAATVLSAFGFFLALGGDSTASNARRNSLLCFGCMSLTMALATKPPALAFMALLVLMATTVASENKVGMTISLKEVRRAVPVFVVAVFLGTFFLWHNIPKFGGICDPALAVGFRDTLLHHLRDPRLFKPSVGSVMFCASSATLILVWKLWNLCTIASDRKRSAPLLWLAALYLTGMAAFTYTPFGVTANYDNDLTSLFFQDRKAMIMYMATAIALSLSIGVICARVMHVKTFSTRSNDSANQVKIFGLSSLSLAFAMICLLVLIPSIDWWWHKDWPLGLTGYETVKGLPPTKIYGWIQSQETAKRVYASGLRPYGLVGRDYEHKLFYDLHSHILKNGGTERLLSVLDQFHPDLVLISVDPHAYTGDNHKPDLVEWMKHQPYFSPVYEDETVSGFRVNDGWRIMLEKYKLPDPPVRMQG